MPVRSGRSVLIVEDDAGVQRSLQKFLELHHFEVTTAETADEAMDAIASRPPDAAIVDLRLPRGSGREVVVSLPAEIPVIIFSAVPEDSGELERIRPKTRLVAKPYSLVMLVETLEDMLRKS